MPDTALTNLAARVAAKVSGPAADATAAAAAGWPAGTAPARPVPRAPAAAARPRAPRTVGLRTASADQDLMLMPGELYFGGEAAAVRTLLGSCVALTLWHARRRIGGMCHFLLPSRQRQPSDLLDGRYGEEAVLELVRQLESHGTKPAEYTAHLYGGADTMSEGSGVKLNVGERNIERGWSLIEQYGFNLDGVDVGDNVPRTVILTLASGDVQCRRGIAR